MTTTYDEEWRSRAEAALKGADLANLDARLSDGIVLRPLHGPTEPVYAGRARSGPWGVVQRVDDDALGAAQAVEDLENGATVLHVVFAGAPVGFGRGVSAATASDLAGALNGVLIDLCPIILSAGARGEAALALFGAHARALGAMPAALHAGIDPYGTFAATGAPFPAPAPRCLDLFDAVGAPGTAFVADGRVVAEAGATPVQELAFALAATAALLRDCAAAGAGPDRVLPRIALGLSASADQFVTIAKLRAARRLHTLLAEACGWSGSATIHVTTQRRMLSVSDPHTNLLRLTIAAFSAGVGGADMVEVLPFEADGRPLARRIGRNIQSLLLEESHVARLDDPAAGSGTVEALTEALARKAWALFQTLDTEGLSEALASGRLQRDVAQSAAAEAEDLAAGRRTMIGVTKHPPAEPRDPSEPPAVPAPERTVRPVPAEADAAARLAAATDDASLADLTAAQPAVTEPMPLSRLAADVEGRPSGGPS